MLLIITLVALVTFFLAKYYRQRLTYWQKKGLPTLNNQRQCIQFVLSQISKGEHHLKTYQDAKKLNSPHAGFYLLWRPIYIPSDLNIMKHILIKDFDSFVDRGAFHDSKDILSMNLFNITGDHWKTLREKLSPIFTSGKLKGMFETIAEKATILNRVIEDCTHKKEPIDVKAYFGRYTTDNIASCAFGLECNSLKDSNDEFRVHGERVMQTSRLRMWAGTLLPWFILAHLGFKKHGTDAHNFYPNVVRSVLKYREDNNVHRNDYMQLLLQLKKSGDKTVSLTENEIIAQCYIFFIAGFETSSTNMTFTMLELAQNPHIQDKLRQDIHKVLKAHNGQLTYEALQEMRYLDQVLNESFRKWPALGALTRICTKEYTIPGTDVVLEKGTMVEIPVWGLQMDPDYYPNPEKFDPDRFSPEHPDYNMERPLFTFGEGPRICIGKRFGVVQSKMGIATLIKDFKFSINEKTKLPLEYRTGCSVITPKQTVWLNVERYAST